MSMNEFCNKHNKNIEFICLDKYCEESPPSCFLCIKNLHNLCDDRYLIIKNETKNIMVESIEKKFYEEEKKTLERTLDLCEFQLIQFLSKFKKDKLAIFENKSNLTTFQDFIENSQLIKQNYKLTGNDSNMIIKPKLDSEKINIRKFQENFKNEFKTISETFQASMAKLNFFFKFNLNLKSFSYNNAFEYKILQNENNEEQEKYQFSLKTGFTSNYFAMVSNDVPKEFSLKIKIDKMVTNERFLDIGMINKSNFNFSNLFINENSMDKYSFCGFKKHQIEGKMNVEGMTDVSGFDDGKEYKVTLKNRVFSVKSLTDDNVDVFYNLKPNLDYYFFIVNYYNGVVFTMENDHDYANPINE